MKTLKEYSLGTYPNSKTVLLELIPECSEHYGDKVARVIIIDWSKFNPVGNPYQSRHMFTSTDSALDFYNQTIDNLK